MRVHALVTSLAVGATLQGARPPEFPGRFIHPRAVDTVVARTECLSLGDDTFDKNVVAVGDCRALGIHDAGRAAGLAWSYATYERRWLLAPNDTVREIEVVLFTRPLATGQRGGASTLQPVWHYRFESDLLVSATPEVVPAAGGGALVSIDECVNGTGGCSQSFARYDRGSPGEVRLGFLDSLGRRFPGAIRHGFHIDPRTLRGSLGLYSERDANCCPSRIAEFSLRLRGRSLELGSLRLRRAN